MLELEAENYIQENNYKLLDLYLLDQTNLGRNSIAYLDKTESANYIY